MNVWSVMKTLPSVAVSTGTSLLIGGALTFGVGSDLVLAWWLRGARIRTERLLFLALLSLGFLVLHSAAHSAALKGRPWRRVSIAIVGAIWGTFSSFGAWVGLSFVEGDGWPKVHASFLLPGSIPLILLITVSTVGWLIGGLAAVGGDLMNGVHDRGLHPK